MKYLKLVEIYHKLEQTTKRLAKTYILSKFLKETDIDSLPIVTLLLQGKLFPNWDENKLGVASKLVLKAINLSTGLSSKKIESDWKKTGDLGKTTENLVAKKSQATLFQSELTIKKVFNNLRKLAEMGGIGTVDKKIKLIAELLTSAKPIEARYIVRSVLEELRVGVGEGSLRDAIVWAFFEDKIQLNYDEKENKVEIEDRENYNKYIDAVQRAYDLTNDFSVVALAAKKGLKALQNMDITIFKPLKVMLALKVADVEEGFKRCGEIVDAEYKLDGFRIQAHKKDNKIRIFTRRLDEVTDQFPDIVTNLKTNVKADSFILDSEAAGFNPKTKKYLPFQSISQRIRRKYNIKEMSDKFPVELNIFDILYLNGKNLIKHPLKERRELIEKIVKQEKRKIVVVPNIITDKAKEIKSFYEKSLAAGNEGIMIKNLDAPYKPGARVNYMVKLKPVMETLDLVIVGAEWGEGKRSNWLSSFTLACIDEDGNFLEIGKVGTGIKEISKPKDLKVLETEFTKKEEEGVTFQQLTEELKPLIIEEDGKEVKVKPKIVLEINYEEIQKSPTYSSGFALRFPRLVNLRTDRSPEEVSQIDFIEDLYYNQNKK